MKTIKLVFLIIVLSMFTCVLSAQQEDKGLGKGQIHNNNQGGNQDGTVKKETKGGVDVDKKQENTQKGEQKGNVVPNNQQDSEKKGQQQGQQQQKQQSQNNKNEQGKSDIDKPVKDKENQNGGENEQKQEQNKSKEGEHKGNAYGKNKDGLTGQEFGKLRSEEAKMQVNNKIDEAVSELDKELEKLNNKKTEIDAAKIRNEEKYKNRAITKEQYDINKTKIAEAENIVSQNKERIQIEKESLKKAKLEIE
ncbi:MAG: hypothetical protein PHW83_10530 [Bacteroidales bacterium]|nr:hypothetical protein [Bacteroidales bacterium]